MTILLVHNYDRESTLEKSLRYVGIDNFVVLKPSVNGPWRNSIKITTILDYLRSGRCTTKFLFYCDSNDAFLTDDPRKAIGHLHKQNCEILFSAESDSYGYEYMPQVKAWANQNATENGCANRYINAGVFIGRAAAIRELFEEAAKYITPTHLSAEEYVRCLRDHSLCGRLPEYPKGVGTDQVILRWLHPHFYPQMKCDYEGKLALR